MNESELRAITDGEMRLAVGWYSGKLANQRQKSLIYYLCLPKHDLTPSEIEGRSSVVSPDVRNTIESMLPQLMVKFSGSERVVEFEATKPGGEPQAEQATDYINHLFHVKNNGELITYTWMKDALLSKNGIVKVWWDTRTEETREEYKGLSDVELSQIMDDDEIEVIEQKAYPDEEDEEQRQEAIKHLTQQLQQAQQTAQMNPQVAQQLPQIQMQAQQQIQGITAQPPKMLYDIACKRTKPGGKVCVENVPPEEFLISRQAKSIKDATFVAHRVMRTQSQLKAMGYKNVDGISGDDQATSLNIERVERLAYDDEYAYINADSPITSDESQRIIWVTECYVRVDYDGDGIAELRKVVRAGNQILENEIVDVAPFVSITPVPMPHKFFGLSVADLAMEAQKIKTSILRGQLDNMYLAVNGRYFAVENQVNLDDLLASRPGGVVRMKQAGMAGRLDQSSGDPATGQVMMEYMQGFLEDSTGWSRQSQGNDPGGLIPQTATQTNIVTNKADMRLDLIARNFAEGFRELFRLMLRLASQFTAKEDIIKLRGEWVPINPREWRNGFDVSLNVGLGTGNKDQQVAHLMALINQQGMGLQIGTATPENLYQAQQELVKALGYKSPDKFFTDPAKAPPRPPQPGPMEVEHMKAQMQQQTEQMKAQAKSQADTQAKQAELQLERERMQMQAQVDTHRQQVEAQQKAQEIEQQMQLEKYKADQAAIAQEREMEFEKWKAQLQAETQIYLGQMTAGQAKPVESEGQPDNMSNALAVAIDGFRASIDKMGAPRQIVRGPDGRAQGIV
jgi:hypothetical protein